MCAVSVKAIILIMLNITLLRDNLEEVHTQLAQRGYVLNSKDFQALHKEKHDYQQEVQHLQTLRRQNAKKMEEAIAKGMKPAEAKKMLQLDDGKGAESNQLSILQDKLREADLKLNDFLLDIPNIPDGRTPIGANADGNKVVADWGEVAHFDFDVRDHLALSNGAIDTDAGSVLAGSRFVVLRGIVARLHRALSQFMLDSHTQKHGYEEHYVPYIVNADALLGTGQLPKFSDDLFSVDDERNFYLIPTAEVPLTNLYQNSILEDTQLDTAIKLVAHTPCFRKEAGNYGQDTRGIIRQHQFDKVELVQLCKPEDADKALDAICTHAEYILQQLVLPYRKVALCTGDLGFAAKRTFDLEVWLPSQNTYREISSCSDFGDFQSRRMRLRYRSQKGEKIFVNTLNGSGLALGRCLVAVLENHQQADGSVVIPKCLLPYMGGDSKIKAQV